MLSKADIVYEFPVEGMQTRVQAIYYGQFPDEFGPIRSTRPYFVDLTREYKGIFLAHGWSPQAKEYLMSDVVPYINAMNSDCEFYRVSDKSAPHNSYITWDEVKSKIDEMGWWDEKQEIRSFCFLQGAQVNEGEAATDLSFVYTGSEFEFSYDEDSGKYTKTISGKEYVDHETGEPITTYNILVQEVTSSVLDLSLIHISYKMRRRFKGDAGGDYRRNRIFHEGCDAGSDACGSGQRSERNTGSHESRKHEDNAYGNAFKGGGRSEEADPDNQSARQQEGCIGMSGGGYQAYKARR